MGAFIDGRKIAEDIRTEIRGVTEDMDTAPRLTIFSCAPNFETRKYLALKEKIAAEVGIQTEVVVFPETVTTEEMLETLKKHESKTNGIILQLPLPEHIDVEMLIENIPLPLDVDALHKSTVKVLPPVAEACREILARHDVSVLDKKVVVVGAGRLVGRPVAKMLTEMGAHVTVLTHESNENEAPLRDADIIVSGAGDPGFIKPEMIKDGVVILDAGTSEDGGMLRGDVDPSCVEKAALLTPVPGGVGPVTVAVLLRNLIILAKK